MLHGLPIGNSLSQAFAGRRVINYLCPFSVGVLRAIRLPPGTGGPGGMGGVFGDLLGGAMRRHGDRPDEINLLIDALADLEDLHMMIMDVIPAMPPYERSGWLATQIQAEAKTEPDLVPAC
jgi:hypothetical protein